ncbi:hypothetical protein H5410_020704 [Solanum commersonii]|uniref:Uncharacterized protein n=1 Tax=Solanum commersonii TaxID=4109 RepID=A0A9J5ZBW4_SOLCO|nr:hypothetical protein H5410_020704 [Solanum commersonii]
MSRRSIIVEDPSSLKAKGLPETTSLPDKVEKLHKEVFICKLHFASIPAWLVNQSITATTTAQRILIRYQQSATEANIISSRKYKSKPPRSSRKIQIPLEYPTFLSFVQR